MLIYKITNKVNHKIYIGKTIRSVETRWKEHIQDSQTSNTPLHLAIKKYGINNFQIDILQDNISSLDELNRLEQYYIEKFNSTSHNNGYNIALGGDGGRISTKLTIDDVKAIIAILQDDNSLLSFSDIGAQFNISKDVIQSINTGMSWYQEDITYPIRTYDTTGLTLSKIEYTEIIHLISSTSLSLSEIGKKYHLSEDQMTAINQGYYCYNNNNTYYRNIYTGTYPIRMDNRQFINDDILKQAIKDIIFTNLSMTKIGNKYGIKGNTLTYIQLGQRHKELTKDFLLPLRKYQKENQIIFQKKGEENSL